MFDLIQKHFKIRMTCRLVSWWLRWEGWWSLKSGVVLFLKCHFKSMRQQSSLKSFLNSGLFTLFWIGAKSNPFYSILISVSLGTLLLKLNTVSDTKLPATLHCSLPSSTMLWFVEHCNFSRMFKISSSCVSNS